MSNTADPLSLQVPRLRQTAVNASQQHSDLIKPGQNIPARKAMLTRQDEGKDHATQHVRGRQVDLPAQALQQSATTASIQIVRKSVHTSNMAMGTPCTQHAARLRCDEVDHAYVARVTSLNRTRRSQSIQAATGHATGAPRRTTSVRLPPIKVFAEARNRCSSDGRPSCCAL
jgi:hypothetical protein